MRTCRQCRYCVPEPSDGWCHRFPPTVVMTTTPNDPGGMWPETRYPSVPLDQPGFPCGEFRRPGLLTRLWRWLTH